VENSETAEDLMNGLNKLNLFEKFSIDRVTKNYVRLKSIDYFGNVLWKCSLFQSIFLTKCTIRNILQSRRKLLWMKLNSM
jgi:hypothetical protein